MTQIADKFHEALVGVQRLRKLHEAAIPAKRLDDIARRENVVNLRLELGAEYTVVAFAGGTGSGKSSLFNSLSGLSFAEAGARRPTTSTSAACVWGVEELPHKLLDWLEIPADRRIARESELDGDEERDLDGLVLVDLPDHDSIIEDHHSVVRQLLPKLDLLILVLDPQKYADQATYTKFLKQLQDRQSRSVVVLNQIDTLNANEQKLVLQDLQQLLADQDLADVDILATSALDGTGLVHLRELLREHVSGKNLAKRTIEQNLRQAGEILAESFGEPLAEPSEEFLSQQRDRWASDIGLATFSQRFTDQASPADQGVRLGALSSTQVAQSQEQLLRDVAADTKPYWREKLSQKLHKPTAVAKRMNRRLADTQFSYPRYERPVTGPAVVGVVALIAFVLGVLAFVLSWPVWVGVLLLLAGFGGLVGALLWRRVRTFVPGDSPKRVQDKVLGEISTVLRNEFVNPLQTVRQLQDQVRAETDWLRNFDVDS